MNQIVIALLFFYGIADAQQPAARFVSALTYDEKDKEVLMFGGAGKDTIFHDLWALKGSTWKKLSDAGPPRIKFAFAYDAHRNVAVLFGGSGTQPLHGDTWEWNGNAWREIKIPGPSARNHPMGIYDRKDKNVLIFGGFSNNRLISDTWVYDGKSWILKDTNGPKHCLPHGLIYDEVRDRIVMLTLQDGRDSANPSRTKNEMWEWTGHSWNQINSGTVLTSANGLQALCSFDKDEIVLFDGDDVVGGKCKTWKFSNGQWSGLFFSQPSTRVGEGMIYDRDKHKSILFGGSDRKIFFNDLWEWDGSQWGEIKNTKK